MSQYDGVFGQLSFSTANFMGRGETFTVSMQTGARVSDYQVAFTEPFLFDRPITGSVDLHKRDIEYLYQFTQGSTGGNLTMGFPMANFSRMYFNYSYDRVYVSDLNQAFFDSGCLFTAEGCETIDFEKLTDEQRQIIEFSPYLKDALLIGQGGRRTISKFTPTFSLNSIDNPITPTSGRRYTASLGVAGIGGNTRYMNPTIEGHLVPAAHGEDLARAARPGRIHPPVRQARARCLSSSGWCLAADTAFAGTICGASGPRIRTAGSSSAATRACCSTPNT